MWPRVNWAYDVGVHFSRAHLRPSPPRYGRPARPTSAHLWPRNRLVPSHFAFRWPPNMKPHFGRPLSPDMGAQSSPTLAAHKRPILAAHFRPLRPTIPAHYGSPPPPIMAVRPSRIGLPLQRRVGIHYPPLAVQTSRLGGRPIHLPLALQISRLGGRPIPAALAVQTFAFRGCHFRLWPSIASRLGGRPTLAAPIGSPPANLAVHASRIGYPCYWVAVQLNGRPPCPIMRQYHSP